MIMLGKPLVYLITPGELTLHNYQNSVSEMLKIIETAVECGVSHIQIREKNLPAKYLAEFVKITVHIAASSQTKILVNERADIAYISGADGVHLRSDSFSAREVKAEFPNLLTIASCHSVEDLQAAKETSADMAVFGPIFATSGKGPAKGIDVLRNACRQMAGFPIIALGGIDEGNYKSALSAGAAGFAAVRYLNNNANLRRLSSEIKNINE